MLPLSLLSVPASARHAGPALIAALRRRFDERHLPCTLHETHISWVLLAGAFAYKIKKPVRLNFLDFSTLAARRRFCEEEVRLNRRLCPDLYLGVVPVRDGPGGPAFEGSGPVLEFAVKMRRLEPHAVATDRLARGLLDAAPLALLARRLCAFHRDAPTADRATDFGSAARVRGDALAALAALHGPAVSLADPDACVRLRAWFVAESDRLSARWDERRHTGRVREGHGDLHLDNVIVHDGEVSAFDCIEFDPALRWIDVMNDIAYLTMDLMAHGRRDLAFGFLDAYLQASGDYEGLDVLRYYLVYRAVVRALVCALREHARAASSGLRPEDYLRLALRLAMPSHGRLLIAHGLPGAGKTYLTQQLLERAGAVRMRSDVERKRLAGVPARSGSDSERLYTEAANDATYRRLGDVARCSLQAGFPTIVDAAFLRRSERVRMQELAHDLHVPFSILDCQAPEALLRERVQRRHADGRDASEADLAVLERLSAQAEPLADDERGCTIEVHTDRPLALATLTGRWLSKGVPG